MFCAVTADNQTSLHKQWMLLTRVYVITAEVCQTSLHKHVTIT